MSTIDSIGSPGVERHPRELPVLFLTEMWERFSFYLMLGLLSLYMVTGIDKGGLGFDEATAGTVFGTYMGLVYMTPFIGGIIADKLIGYRKAVVLGAITMIAGHISLAFESIGMFYLGLGLLIVGNGLFKPNISTMLGRLYPEGSTLRDNGFNIFYIGINLGAFICNFVAAIVRNKYGWHAAFGTAGVGLFIGLLTFMTKYASLARAEIRTTSSTHRHDTGLSTLLAKVLPAAAVIGTGCYWIWGVNGAFFGACLPIVVFYIHMWMTANVEEKGRIGAVLAISALLVPFWMVFNLNGTALTFWAEQNTQREVPEWSTSALKKVDLLQEAPIEYFLNAGEDTPRPGNSWLNIIHGSEEEIATAKGAYAKKLGEVGYKNAGPIPVSQAEWHKMNQNVNQKLEPGERHVVANTELFQSINPLFILFFTPLLLGFWSILRKYGKAPNTTGKMAIGMVLAAICWLVMLSSVDSTNDGTVKAPAFNLINAYLWITLAELCISPIGLSLVTKMAPEGRGAVLMGGFFLSISVGNKLSGLVGGPVWKATPHSDFFLSLIVIMIFFAIIIWFAKRRLDEYMPPEE